MTTTAHGLITGSGYVHLLDAVSARVSDATGTQAILDVIASEQARIDPRRTDDARWQLINLTGWVLTYAASDGSPRIVWYHRMRSRGYWDPPPENDDVVIGMDSSAGHKLWTLPPSDALIWLPEAQSEQEEREWETLEADLYARVASELKVCATDEPIQDTLQHNTTLMLWVHQEAARRLPTSIGPQFHFGIHTDENQFGVLDPDALGLAP